MSYVLITTSVFVYLLVSGMVFGIVADEKNPGLSFVFSFLWPLAVPFGLGSLIFLKRKR